MTSFFTSRYSATLSSLQLPFFRWASLRRWVIRRTANILLPVYYRLTDAKAGIGTKDTTKAEGRLIVSLSSFPARISRVWITLESLLRQTHKPDMIILWLSKLQFPNEMADLPDQLVALLDRGLTIRFVDKDYRSHRKYLYVLKEYPKDILLTVDDDLIYPPCLLEDVWQMHLSHPSAIIASYAHGKEYDALGHIRPYLEWRNNSMSGPFFFCSGGGTLFPAGCLHTDTTDIDTALELCPNADDVWLNFMALKQGTSIVHSPKRWLPLPVLSVSSEKLSTNNVYEHGNDRQIAAVAKHFNMTL